MKIAQKQDENCYRAGFIGAMKDIQNNHSQHRDTILKSHTEWYAAGYQDANDHFAGFDVISTLAYDLNLISVYDGFWGQSTWCHPEK